MNKKQQGMLSYFLIILGAIIISKMSGIKLSMCVLMVFLPFIVAGFVILGKKFTIKAALGSVVYMLGLEFFERIPFALDTDHFESIKQVTIITQEPDTLITEIKNKLNKTCTIMDSRGAIAGENNTLICYVSYFELPMMKDIISEHSGSFSTVSTIDEILR